MLLTKGNSQKRTKKANGNGCGERLKRADEKRLVRLIYIGRIALGQRRLIGMRLLVHKQHHAYYLIHCTNGIDFTMHGWQLPTHFTNAKLIHFLADFLQ